jgi:hypothetical protein
VSLCLTAGAATLIVAWSAFTLSWTHSVERTAWQEDWRVLPDGLQITEARIQATGAGMEPPATARFEDGWWIYRPSLAPLPRLVLARSDATAEWRICFGGECLDVRQLVPAAEEAVILHPCSE